MPNLKPTGHTRLSCCSTVVMACTNCPTITESKSPRMKHIDHIERQYSLSHTNTAVVIRLTSKVRAPSYNARLSHSACRSLLKLFAFLSRVLGRRLPTEGALREGVAGESVMPSNGRYRGSANALSSTGHTVIAKCTGPGRSQSDFYD
jgi:hypothetical protein